MSRSSFSSWLAAALVSVATPLVCSAGQLEQANLVLATGLTNTLEFVFVQGGEFLMGCPPKPLKPWQSSDTATPEHKVFVSPFLLGKFPVTVAQFCEYLNKSHHAPPTVNSAVFLKHVELRNGAYSPAASKDSHPIVVSFKDAEGYCTWLSEFAGRKCRLPTEAEWEFAAKGGKKNRTYPWGEEVKETRPNPLNQPIGAHPELATPDGIFDLNGPVYQWCKDIYNDSFYSMSPYKDPVCRQGSGRRVIRGGPMFRVFGKSVFDERLYLAPTWRRFQSDESGAANIGFRVVVQP